MRNKLLYSVFYAFAASRLSGSHKFTRRYQYFYITKPVTYSSFASPSFPFPPKTYLKEMYWIKLFEYIETGLLSL